jgi:hypothetical protein
MLVPNASWPTLAQTAELWQSANALPVRRFSADALPSPTVVTDILPGCDFVALCAPVAGA